MDLGVRISKAGHRIITNPAALVYHSRAPMTRVSQVARRVFTYGRADSWLVGKHPDLSVWYANPFVLSLAAAGVGMALRGRGRRPGRLAGPAMLGFLMLREALSRHERGSGARGLARDTVCTAVDMCFDLGEVVAAAHRRRPFDALRRFRYVQPQWFSAVSR